MNFQITIQNAERNNKAIINRTLLSDCYNYYITIYTYSNSSNCWFINENIKQTETILSKNKAIEIAEKIIG